MTRGAGMVEAYRSADEKVILNHVHGVPWWEAPIPPRWHRCKTQTQGWTGYFTEVLRCACGAASLNGGQAWLERNSRRKTQGTKTQ